MPAPPRPHRLAVGRFDVRVLDDGATDYATADLLFANAPEGALRERLAAHRLEPRRIVASTNCLLVAAGPHLVLIDTGHGRPGPPGSGTERAGRLRPALAAAGVRPEDVTAVVLTHRHPDHIGGSVDAAGRPVFARARHLLWASEAARARGEPAARRVLDALGARLELLAEATEVVPGLTVRPAPGHTVGHAVVELRSGGEALLATADLFAHPIAVERPEWRMRHEEDPARALRSRRDLLARAAADGALVHAFHFPFPGLGRVVGTEVGWRWRPLATPAAEAAPDRGPRPR